MLLKAPITILCGKFFIKVCAFTLSLCCQTMGKLQLHRCHQYEHILNSSLHYIHLFPILEEDL